MWTIVIKEEGRAPKQVPLPAEGVSRLGRALQCDLRVQSRKVSRHQLTLRVVADGVELVVDPDAHSHCRAGGQRIEPGVAVILKDGEAIWAGDVLLELKETGKRGPIESEAGPFEGEQIPVRSDCRTASDQSGVATISTAGHDAVEVPSALRLDLEQMTCSLKPGPSGEENKLEKKIPFTSDWQVGQKDADSRGNFAEDPRFTAQHGDVGIPTRTNPAFGGTRTATGDPRTIPPGATAAGGREEEVGATSFLPIEEARRVIKESAAKRRKKFLLVLGALGGGLVALGLLKDPGARDSQIKNYNGMYFTIDLDKQWHARSEGAAVVFSATRSAREGILVARHQDSALLTYDYVRAVEFAKSCLTESVGALGGVEWGNLNADSQLPFLRGVVVDGIPYVACHGRMNQKGAVLLRVYLSHNQLVMVAAWSPNGSMSPVVDSMMDSFFLLPSIAPDYVRRDLKWSAPNFKADAVAAVLKESDYLLEQHLAAPENAWKAYSKALEVLRFIGRDAATSTSPELADPVDLWKNYLLPSALTVQSDYRDRVSLINSARSSGSHAQVMKLSAEIKERIPDSQDPRWMWAQKEYIAASERLSGRRSLF